MSRRLASFLIGSIMVACSAPLTERSNLTGGAGGNEDDVVASDAPPADEVVMPSDAPVESRLPRTPLRSSGRWVLDASGARYKLASITWRGLESKDHVFGGLDKVSLTTLVKTIKEFGFNSVRIPWSSELVEQNPSIDERFLTANPSLHGLPALEILDRVIDELGREGITTVLANYGGGLWYTAETPEAAWLEHWAALARRYRQQPAVIAADLRDDLNGATWGKGDAKTDWNSAAERAGARVLAENPNLLIAVQGIDHSKDFRGVSTKPITLPQNDRLVYAPHDAGVFYTKDMSPDALFSEISSRWGFILVQGRPYTAPLWVEVSTCNSAPSCIDDKRAQGLWFRGIRSIVARGDIDWTYRSLNGGDVSGVLDPSWTKSQLPDLLTVLQAMQPIKQRP